MTPGPVHELGPTSVPAPGLADVASLDVPDAAAYPDDDEQQDHADHDEPG